MVIVFPNTINFQPNLEEFKEKITPRTKAVIINSPNNPTGVIYSEATIIKLSEILREKQSEFGTDIYLVSDEPYRELAYDNAKVPYLSKYYENTIIGYSFSKSLSLPGERIGYLVIPNQVADYEDIISAANIANRILGFVNAPSLFQRVVAKCLNAKIDLETYNRNRELLYKGLSSYGSTNVLNPKVRFTCLLKLLLRMMLNSAIWPRRRTFSLFLALYLAARVMFELPIVSLIIKLRKHCRTLRH